MMRSFFSLLLLLILCSATTFSQRPKPKPYASKKQAGEAKLKAEAAREKEELEKALAETDLTLKITALRKFNENYPKSTEKIRVLEIIVSTRAQLADEKLRAGDAAGGIELFKQAVTDAPAPISDKLFTEVIGQFPTNLFYRGEQAAAIEVAKLIEEKISDNAKQLLALSAFYLGTENAAAARSLAEKAIALDANLPAAYQALGFANRMAFQLEESVTAYQRALELDPESAISKRSLAEMKRATGKTGEAITLYRELLEKNPEDAAAQTGLALALFSAEKQAEAETELARGLEKNPGNLPLLVGAAYWYAAHRDGAKAVDYAQKAVAIEPRYTWARIALARGFLVQGNPLEAERQLLAARQYGNFPTLDYEIASARLAAGFYEEAARELKKSFSVAGDELETKLGNRVSKQAKNFIELIELERRASILEPLAADDPQNAERLKSLLRFNQIVSAENAKDEETEQIISEFIKGDDKARIHRQLYAASRLLEAKKHLPKVLELIDGAINAGVETGLEVPTASAAVMADELFESRNIAMARNEVVVVPEIPRQTLVSIMRGRIEELAGWTLYQQNKPQEAIVRLKRAVGILPEKSAWWRSSTWRLGAALEAAGRQPEALEIYVKNYQNSQPDVVKYSVIETLYQRINGSTDGLEKKIGAKPAGSLNVAPTPESTAAAAAAPSPSPSDAAATTETPTPTPETAAAVETTKVEPVETTQETKAPQSEDKTEVKPEEIAENEKPGEKTEEKTEEKTPEKVEPSPVPIDESTPENKPTPEIKPETSPSPAAEIKTESNQEKKPETAENKSAPVDEPVSKPAVDESAIVAKPSPKPLFDPIVITVPKTEAATAAAKPDKSLKETTGENPAGETAKAEEKNKDENKPADANDSGEASEARKSTIAAAESSGEIRQRRLPPNPPTRKSSSSSSENNSCRLTVNKESLTLLSQGIGEGIRLGFEGAGEEDLSQITPVSGNPNDVIVALDPKIPSQPNRAFYIIKSVSPTKGIFTVTFDSPCGKKEVLVKVR